MSRPSGKTWRGMAEVKDTSDKSSTRHRASVDQLETTDERDLRRIKIAGIGEAEVEIQPDGSFKDQPFAVHGPRTNMPEIHRMSGVTEGHERFLRGRFKVSRDGHQVTEGSFDLKEPNHSS